MERRNYLCVFILRVCIIIAQYNMSELEFNIRKSSLSSSSVLDGTNNFFIGIFLFLHFFFCCINTRKKIFTTYYFTLACIFSQCAPTNTNTLAYFLQFQTLTFFSFSKNNLFTNFSFSYVLSS